MIKYASFFYLSLFLVACQKYENHLLCTDTQKTRVIEFAFNQHHIWIDNLPFFDTQSWVKKLEITPDQILLVDAQPIFYGVPETNHSYDALLMMDYQLDRKTGILSIIRYFQEIPETLASKEEEETKFSCRKYDLVYAAELLIQNWLGFP